MEFLRVAIAAGGAPQIVASGATVLRNGRKFRQLVTSAGKLTVAGRLYQGETGAVLDTNSYDTEQTPRREGNAEYISMRRGPDRIVRKYDTATSKWVYTQSLGKKFFEQRRVQYVVKVPATFEGKRANGAPYSRLGFFPLNENISTPLTDSMAQRDRKIKAHVRSIYPTGILAEYSEETISIRDAEWHIVSMTTQPGAAGEAPRTDVRERALAGHPSISSLPMPESLCAAAFETHGDKLCCARQIA